MATTTNYGWTTPDDTALVKDGASAIRTLGSSVDTTTKALNPSTTLGDIEYRSSTANTNTRLGIGTTGQVLSVSGGVPSWATVSSGGITLISTTTLSGSTVTLSSIPQTYKNLYIVVRDYLPSADTQVLGMRFNGSSTASTYFTAETVVITNQAFNGSYIENGFSDNAVSQSLITITIPDYANTDTYKGCLTTSWQASYTNTDNMSLRNTTGVWKDTSAISSLVMFAPSGTYAGTLLLYGVS
jgi:hypothetical protein